MSCNVTTYDLVINPSNLGKIEMHPIFWSSIDDDFIKAKTMRKIEKHKWHAKYWQLVDFVLTIEMAKTLPIFEELDVRDKVEKLPTSC